jgi:hypothetical protein
MQIISRHLNISLQHVFMIKNISSQLPFDTMSIRVSDPYSFDTDLDPDPEF